MLKHAEFVKNTTNTTEAGMKLSFDIVPRDFTSAGEASSKIKRVLRQIGMPSEIIRRTAIIAYEAEMNLVIHSVGGRLLFSVCPNRIEIKAEDDGPGIADLELAMTAGYSTASEEIREMGFGAGMGLPNIKGCSDEFSIESAPGAGTKLLAAVYFNDDQVG